MRRFVVFAVVCVSGWLVPPAEAASADLAVSVTHSPEPVAANQSVTFTVTVTNNGPDAAPNARLDVGSFWSEFQSATVPAGWTCALPTFGASSNFYCVNTSFPPSTIATFTFVDKLTLAKSGKTDWTRTRWFIIKSDAADPAQGNNQINESVSYDAPSSDLSVSVSDSPDPVGYGEDLTYTIAVNNSGPDPAPNARLEISSFTGPSLHYRSLAGPPGWTCPAPATDQTFQILQCTSVSATVGLATFTLVIRIVSQYDDTLKLNFHISTDGGDPQPLNDYDTELTTYNFPTSGLGVVALVSPDPVVPGNDVTYNGQVRNVGPDAAPDVTLTIPLVPALRFRSINPPSGFTCSTPAVGSSGTVTCSATTLPVNWEAPFPFSLIAQVDPSLLSGPDDRFLQTFEIHAAVAHDSAISDNVCLVISDYVTPDADLSVTNSASPDPAVVGGTIVYTQTLTNLGPDTATNATLIETLPPAVAFEMITAPTGWTCITPSLDSSGPLQCSNSSFGSGMTAVFSLVVRVLTAGPITNSVAASSGTYDPNTPNNTAAATANAIVPGNAPISRLALTVLVCLLAFAATTRVR